MALLSVGLLYKHGHQLQVPFISVHGEAQGLISWTSLGLLIQKLYAIYVILERTKLNDKICMYTKR